jgi:UDP-N-acetyl-D-galactosamine dehydrogenase
VGKQEVQNEYGLTSVEAPKQGNYDAVILTVAHDKTRDMGAKQIRTFCKENHLLYDLKYIFSKNETDLRL